MTFWSLWHGRHWKAEAPKSQKVCAVEYARNQKRPPPSRGPPQMQVQQLMSPDVALSRLVQEGTRRHTAQLWLWSAPGGTKPVWGAPDEERPRIRNWGLENGTCLESGWLGP